MLIGFINAKEGMVRGKQGGEAGLTWRQFERS